MQEAGGKSSRITHHASFIILTAILFVAAYLRFTNLHWDEGLWIHPDEAHMQNTLGAIHTPDNLSLYFDTHNSPLNVRNNQDRRYSYGTLPLFLTRITTEWLDRACDEPPDILSVAIASLFVGPPDADSTILCHPGTFTGGRSKQVGRALSGLADLGTLLLIYLIGRRLYAESVGLLAAGLGALTAFSIQQAHFFTVDSMACFFTILTVYFSVRAGQSGSWASFALAGLATGLAAACKVSAAPAALLVVLAAVWRWTQPLPRSLAPLLLRLSLAALLAIIAFRIAQPYAFEGPGFFGLRPSPEWFERLGQIAHEQSGEVDFPSGRQWANRAAILFPLKDILFWGMGLPLGLAACAGWALAGIELWRGKRAHLILWGWGTLLFLYHGTRWVKTMRTFLPLYPILAILAAYFLVRLCRAPSRRWRGIGLALTTSVVIGAALWAGAVFSIYLRPHTRLISSRWIIANIPPGSTLANEHWDWGPPLRVDGLDPMGGMFDGFEMQLYNEDDENKRAQLFDWLDRADYIIIGSNRLYASISRLPARYPLTTEYYRALFAGELGFDLLADFSSYPALGPFQFPDQEEPYPLIDANYTYQTSSCPLPLTSCSLPPADEAFSVYDHPRVLIFRKTDEYSRQLVEHVLGGIDVERALRGLTPIAASAAPSALEFDPQTWADQQAGGTWVGMFDRSSLLNRHPALAAIAWWIVVTVLGWLAFPLLFAALPRLRDRGYGLARVLGLLLLAYLTWLAASLRVLPNTRGTILRMALLLALVGGGIGWFQREKLRRFLLVRWRLILLIEGLFALLYVAWIGVRLLQPDLWHPVVGGEKPMDFAYLNAVMKSTWFPPYNPWFSGSYINYYYFGFVIIGTLTKLIGTVPALAYNLALPLLFALTGVGAFSVAYNLFGGRKRGRLLAGLAALAFTVLLGNLGVVHLIRAKLIGLGGELFPSTIPALPETVAMLRGLWEVVAHGAKLSMRPESWYWHPTRIIPIDPGEIGPITEFPAFTFLYGDLHAHMIAFPLALLALTLAIYWAQTSHPRWLSLALGGLVIGALYPTNTWDYPTYLLLGLGALAVGALRSKLQFKSLIWRAILLVGLTMIFYIPYTQHYATGYTSLEKWNGSRTPVDIYFWILGALLFPLVTFMLIEGYRIVTRNRLSSKSLVSGGLAVIGLTLLVWALVILGYEVALVTVPLAILAALLFFAPGTPSHRRLVWLMVGGAMALCLAVEIVVLKGDIGRMNTVFKFYLQVWMLLSIAAAVSLAHLKSPTFDLKSRPWWAVMAALILGSALFLPYGIRARATDRMSPQTGLTLDGMAYMEHSAVFDGSPERGSQEIPLSGDYAAIRWIQDHIAGSPVILEGLSYREYLWGNRVSIYTGLPTVVGWRWHQVQQRAVLPTQMVDWRRDDVNACYDSTDASRALQVLSRYGVRYIYVGEYERAYYDPAGLAKFDAMVAQELLQVVYDEQGVKIYEVIADLASYSGHLSHNSSADRVHVVEE